MNYLLNLLVVSRKRGRAASPGEREIGAAVKMKKRSSSPMQQVSGML